MRHSMTLLGAVASVTVMLLAASPAHSADSYGVNGEKLVTVKGKVVDLACEVTGTACNVPNCGGGKRPLGLVLEDGTLYVAAKSNTIFAGLLHDIVSQCGKTIIADGLTTTSRDATLLMIQRYKTTDDGEWITTDKFAADWAKQHSTTPDSKITDEWFRTDWVVKGAVARHGKLGVPN